MVLECGTEEFIVLGLGDVLRVTRVDWLSLTAVFPIWKLFHTVATAEAGCSSAPILRWLRFSWAQVESSLHHPWKGPPPQQHPQSNRLRLPYPLAWSVSDQLLVPPLVQSRPLDPGSPQS